ncbi:MAG: hypothetical protein N2505_04055 [Endomicrobia bacterium]|nr:hypothetical protein [Endomicrobiia bacterium]
MVYLIIIFLSIIFFSSNTMCFFNQKESGFAFENILSLPVQSEYQGLGYVNNSLININSANIVNPAVMYEVFYKELNFFYQPLVMDSKLISANFITSIKTDKLYLPVGISLVNLTSEEAEKINIFKESYGYNFKESLTYANVAIAYYLKNYDINLGLNYKNIFQTIDEYYTYGANIDLGIITPTNKHYIWGISMLNIFPVNFGSDIFPTIIRTSLNHYVGKIFFSEVRLYTEVDFVNIFSIEKISVLWGIGTTYKFFYLPIALSFAFSYYGASVGVDIKKDNFNISYALNFNMLGPMHRFSLGYKFDFYPDETRKILKTEIEKIKLEKQKFITEYKQKKDEIIKAEKNYKLQQQITLNLLKAKNLITEKNYKEAKILLTHTLQLDPTNIQAKEMLNLVNSYMSMETAKILYSEAASLYEKGMYDVAIDKLNRLLELYPQHTQARVLVAICTANKLIIEHKYQEAKNVLFDILEIEPTNEQVLNLLKKIDTLLELEK